MAKKSKIQRELKLVRIGNNSAEKIKANKDQRMKISQQFQALKERGAAGENVEQEAQNLRRDAMILSFSEQKIPRAARMIRRRRRCAISGRPRGIFLGLSRNKIRESVWAGELAGAVKYSW